SLQRPLPVPLHRLTAYLRRGLPPTQWQRRILSRGLSSTSPVPTKTPPARSRLQSSCSAGQLPSLPACPTYRRPLLPRSLRLTHAVWKQRPSSLPGFRPEDPSEQPLRQRSG